VSLLQDLTGVSTGSGLIQKADSEGTLAAGFRVDTYLLHFDPWKERGERYSLTGTVRLPRPILGVICVAEDIQASNTLLGAPGIRYSDRGVGQGLEFGEGEGGDRATISEDRRSLSVALSISKRRNVDQIRILVESVPIP